MATRVTLLAHPAPHALRTLVFSARGPEGRQLWLDDGAAQAPLVLRASWHRYVVPISGNGRIDLGLGRVGGRVEITGLRLIGVQAFVLRRDFAHGIVIVNPTDIVQRVPLGRAYRVLSGDQNPWANTGRRTRTMPVARYRSVILLDE